MNFTKYNIQIQYNKCIKCLAGLAGETKALDEDVGTLGPVSATPVSLKHRPDHLEVKSPLDDNLSPLT